MSKDKKIKVIILTILLLIIFLSGVSFSSMLYKANEVKYTDDKSVKEALDELYNFKGKFHIEAYSSGTIWANGLFYTKEVNIPKGIKQAIVIVEVEGTYYGNEPEITGNFLDKNMEVVGRAFSAGNYDGYVYKYTINLDEKKQNQIIVKCSSGGPGDHFANIIVVY